MTEKDWEKLLRIKTTAGMTPDQTHTGIRMNQLLTKCLTSWPTPESSARTILCLIMAVGKDESVFSWLIKPNVTLLA